MKKRSSMTVTKVMQAKARVTAKLKGLKSMKNLIVLSDINFESLTVLLYYSLICFLNLIVLYGISCIIYHIS